MNVNPLTRLRFFIIDYYDLAAFQLLCHDLSIRYDLLGGDNRLDVKADRLLHQIGQKRRFNDLLALLHTTRRDAYEHNKLDELTAETLTDAYSSFLEEQRGETNLSIADRGTTGFRKSNRYQIQEELGRGSFAVVYKAFDIVLNRTVALKILHPHMRGAPEAVARFKFEAQISGNLRHPNIIRVEDFGYLDDEQLFLAMDYLPGHTLQYHLNRYGILDLDQAIPILEQVAAALDYAHEKGVIHRDLKPANIMLVETGDSLQATLTDFGLVKAIEGSMALSIQAGYFGTMEYMAPEQADINRQREIGPATDRYALGVLSYRLLTGQTPFPGNSWAVLGAIINNHPPTPREINKEIPKSTETALLKMLDKAPDKRFESCKAFVTALARQLLDVRYEQLVRLYEKMLEAIEIEEWTQVLILGGQIRSLDPHYLDVQKQISLAQDNLRQSSQQKFDKLNIYNSDLKIGKSIISNSILDERDVWTNPITGKEMVRIPAGLFLFGAKLRERELPDFWIDKTPVTNLEYAKFVAETGYKTPKHWEGKKEPPLELVKHPVVHVNMNDAEAFAIWGKGSLPSEMQWEKAARGIDGRQFPWGDAWEDDLCNTKESGIGKTTPVGLYSPQGDSPYGCVDFSGNVWEWTNQIYLVKGGSWAFAKDSARTISRGGYFWMLRLQSYGFRTVVDNPF